MPALSRRAFALSFAAASAAGVPLAAISGHRAHARPGGPRRPLPPLARIRVGRFEVTALNDGHADMPFAYFTGRPPGEIQAAAATALAARAGGLRLAFNQYLIDDGERLILVDTGAAGLLGQSGHLPAALDAIGVKAEEIDAIILTHLHRDHISGLVAGGRRNFPNAEVLVDRREVAHWTDPAKRSAAPDFLRESFDLSAEVVRLYPKLQRIDGEREVVRGVSIVDLAGHTPGHVGVRIEDAGQSLLMVADALFHPSLHPGATDIGFIFEQDPAAAQAMREKLFPRAAEEGGLIAATHMPFPGLGRIVKDGTTRRWIPAEWAYLGL